MKVEHRFVWHGGYQTWCAYCHLVWAKNKNKPHSACPRVATDGLHPTPRLYHPTPVSTNNS